MTSLAITNRASRRARSAAKAANRLRKRVAAIKRSITTWLTCLSGGHAQALVGVPGDVDWQCGRCGRVLGAARPDRRQIEQRHSAPPPRQPF